MYRITGARYETYAGTHFFGRIYFLVSKMYDKTVIGAIRRPKNTRDLLLLETECWYIRAHKTPLSILMYNMF